MSLLQHSLASACIDFTRVPHWGCRPGPPVHLHAFCIRRRQHGQSSVFSSLHHHYKQWKNSVSIEAGIEPKGILGWRWEPRTWLCRTTNFIVLLSTSRSVQNFSVWCAQRRVYQQVDHRKDKDPRNLFKFPQHSIKSMASAVWSRYKFKLPVAATFLLVADSLAATLRIGCKGCAMT